MILNDDCCIVTIRAWSIGYIPLDTLDPKPCMS